MSQSERIDLRQMVSRLSPGERVIGAASVVVLLGLLLNWISISCSGAFCGGAGGGASGFHGWGWLTFLALVGVAGLLVARRLLAGTVRLPDLPAPDPVLYMAGGALEILGCLLFWVEYHDAFVSTGGGGVVSVSSGLGFGWFLALLGGVATVVGGYMANTAAAPAPGPLSPPSGGPEPL